jgi:hypothetical protein
VEVPEVAATFTFTWQGAWEGVPVTTCGLAMASRPGAAQRVVWFLPSARG